MLRPYRQCVAIGTAWRLNVWPWCCLIWVYVYVVFLFPMSKILIVDDDPHIRELVRVFLQNEGFAVAEADDGIAALATLETLKADLVILDVMMPNMDGWELCRELRTSYDIPVLMLTAKGET